MHAGDSRNGGELSRRALLAGSAALCCLGDLRLPKTAAGAEAGADDSLYPPPNPKCLRCGGIGRVPLSDAKPFVWLKGAAHPRWETMVGEQFCPECQKNVDPAVLAEEARQYFEAALEKHVHWEHETGWKLACVITRNVVIHTQLSTSQAKTVGLAVEAAILHIKRLTSSLALASSRPDKFGIMMLWERASWDKFRTVMERLYTPEQRGAEWAPARDYNAYDHYEMPHMYETPQTARNRPPSCGATFLTMRRQLQLAANSNLPFWLLEGFAAYGDNAVHKVNRWYSVYDVKQIAVGNWLTDARKLAGDGKLRPWNEMMKRELSEWEWEDHVQTMAMAAFLLESEPLRFLDLIRRLKAGDNLTPALESAYRATTDELDQNCTRWLVARH
jgi:hypothetical protein